MGTKNMSPGTTRPTFPTHAPKDGETWQESTVLNSGAVVQDVLDYAGYIEHRLEAVLGVRSTATTRIVSCPPSISAANASKWSLGGNGSLSLQTVGGVVEWQINAGDAPHGVTIQNVIVSLAPTPGRGGLPATMPKVEFLQLPHGSPNPTVISSIFDPSASLAVYETAHDIMTASLGQTIDRTLYTYWVRFTAESGANSLSNVGVYSAGVVFNNP